MVEYIKGKKTAISNNDGYFNYIYNAKKSDHLIRRHYNQSTSGNLIFTRQSLIGDERYEISAPGAKLIPRAPMFVMIISYSKVKTEKVIKMMTKHRKIEYTRLSEIDLEDYTTVINERLRTNHDVIYDREPMKMKERIEILNNIKDINCTKVCILITPLPEEINRVDSIEDEKIFNKFEPPYFYEGWHYIIPWYLLLDSFSDVDMNEIVTNDITWKDVMNYDQNNPNHTYTLGGHIETIQEEIETKYPEEYHLIDTAIFHDIGKIYTRTDIDKRGNVSNRSHYYNHDRRSAYYLLSMNNAYAVQSYKDKYADISKIHFDLWARFVYDLYVSILIYWHMGYIRWRDSEKTEKADRKLIGIKIAKELDIIHEADMNAK